MLGGFEEQKWENVALMQLVRMVLFLMATNSARSCCSCRHSIQAIAMTSRRKPTQFKKSRFGCGHRVVGFARGGADRSMNRRVADEKSQLEARTPRLLDAPADLFKRQWFQRLHASTRARGRTASLLGLRQERKLSPTAATWCDHAWVRRLRAAKAVAAGGRGRGRGSVRGLQLQHRPRPAADGLEPVVLRCWSLARWI
jgi:hypothetical protein